MTKSLKLAALTGAALFASAMLPATAMADGVIIIDKDAAIQGSAALQGAVAQIKVTYAATITQWEARGKALDAGLQPQVVAFQAAQKVANPNRVLLQSQYAAIQAKQQEGAAELQRMFAPVQRAQDYAVTQIGTHLESALKAVMTKRSANVVLVPQATVAYQPSAEATQDLIAQLNVEVPSVSTAVPAGWVAGQPIPGAAAPTSGGR